MVSSDPFDPDLIRSIADRDIEAIANSEDDRAAKEASAVSNQEYEDQRNEQKRWAQHAVWVIFVILVPLIALAILFVAAAHLLLPPDYRWLPRQESNYLQALVLGAVITLALDWIRDKIR